MPEVPNAYKCDYCHALMQPIEHKDARWHTKWCSQCGVKLYDVFIGDDSSPLEGWCRLDSTMIDSREYHPSMGRKSPNKLNPIESKS